MRRFLLMGVIVFLALGATASEFSITVAPGAHLSYRGEGKILPQGYVNRFDGNTAPLYRLEWMQDARPEGFWGIGLWHTGVFGGGTYGKETLPDVTTGGTYQSNDLNVGFTNLFVTYHRPLEGWPVEAQFHLSVVREIFKRKAFVVTGTSAGGVDDVNELSAEGIGFGLAGTHGRRLYFRWQTAAHYYVQLFDAETDASAGSIFQGEAGVGYRITPKLALEFGGLWQDWFILGQGNRRLHLENTDGAVISYNRNQTVLSGLFFRLETRFGK
ncbi:MAG: hypothetical protein IPN90_05570 [Elusimicrobia bacterium]|nr:hypothetical protein [Elusimicrobiota bacterium]